MDLVVLVGLQASGKSSFYRDRFLATHVLVSKDLMRNARDKEARQQRLVREALSAGRSVVVDNTNVSLEARAPLVALGRAHGARLVAYLFESDLAACLVRNAARDERARVPKVALFATARRLAVPSLAEGFDEIHHVRLRPPHGFDVSW